MYLKIINIQVYVYNFQNSAKKNLQYIAHISIISYIYSQNFTKSDKKRFIIINFH